MTATTPEEEEEEQGGRKVDGRCDGGRAWHADSWGLARGRPTPDRRGTRDEGRGPSTWLFVVDELDLIAHSCIEMLDPHPILAHAPTEVPSAEELRSQRRAPARWRRPDVSAAVHRVTLCKQ